MKLKLIAAAIALAASGLASATTMTVDAAVGYTGAFGATGINGTITAGTTQYLGSATLVDALNVPTYGYTFNIGAAASIAGYTFSHTQWSVFANTQAGGSANTTNPAGTYIDTFNSNTFMHVGTGGYGSSNVLSSSATAGNSVAGSIDESSNVAFYDFGTTWDLSTTTNSGNTGGYANFGNAFTLSAFASASDSYASDGSSGAVFTNYANVAVLARYVYTQDAPPAVPEPATALLVGLGLLGAAAARRNKKA